MSLPDHQFDAIVRSETQAPLFNVGCGEDLTIAELAETLRDVVGFKGKLTYDRSKPRWNAAKTARCKSHRRSRMESSYSVARWIGSCLSAIPSRKLMKRAAGSLEPKLRRTFCAPTHPQSLASRVAFDLRRSENSMADPPRFTQACLKGAL